MSLGSDSDFIFHNHIWQMGRVAKIGGLLRNPGKSANDTDFRGISPSLGNSFQALVKATENRAKKLPGGAGGKYYTTRQPANPLYDN